MPAGLLHVWLMGNAEPLDFMYPRGVVHSDVNHSTLPVLPLDRKTLQPPAGLAGAVERALLKNPDERFERCAGVARAALADVRPQPNKPGVVRLFCPGSQRILKGGPQWQRRFPVLGAVSGTIGSMAAFAASQVLTVPQGVSSRWLKAQGCRLG